MATSSQHQETPEYRTFREHYDRLYHAIQDPLSLATQLFTRNIITSAVKGKMSIVGLSTLEKTSLLLSAVEGQIQTDPRVFHVFLSTLNEDTSMKLLVKSMQGMVSYKIYSDCQSYFFAVQNINVLIKASMVYVKPNLVFELVPVGL